jgi:hypothetical protein
MLQSLSVQIQQSLDQEKIEEIEKSLKLRDSIIGISCNWGFHLSNWQKVQLNTDLLKFMKRYLLDKMIG